MEVPVSSSLCFRVFPAMAPPCSATSALALKPCGFFWGESFGHRCFGKHIENEFHIAHIVPQDPELSIEQAAGLQTARLF